MTWLLDEDRYAPSVEVAMIRRALASHAIGRSYGDYDGIRFRAHNVEEVEAITALLTPAERQLVAFTWYGWGRA